MCGFKCVLTVDFLLPVDRLLLYLLEWLPWQLWYVLRSKCCYYQNNCCPHMLYKSNK